MTDDKSPVDQVLDLFLYAPLGFALDARSLVPKLAERGRSQLSMARMIGQFAVTQGQNEAGRQLSKVEEQVQKALVDLGLAPTTARRSASSATMAGAGTASAAHPAATPGPASPAPKLTVVPDPVIDPSPPAVVTVPDASPAAAPRNPRKARRSTSELAIPDYDSLAASQVVPRLAGLSVEELAAVRRYESAKRGRKTILNRIAQLQSA